MKRRNGLRSFSVYPPPARPARCSKTFLAPESPVSTQDIAAAIPYSGSMTGPAACVLRGVPRLMPEQPRVAGELGVAKLGDQDVAQAERRQRGDRQPVAGAGEQPVPAGRSITAQAVATTMPASVEPFSTLAASRSR